MRKIFLILISIIFFSFLLFFISINFPKEKQKPLSLLSKLITQTQNQKVLYIPEHLTLDKIFADNHDWTATLSAEQKITIIATGDYIPARSVNFMATQKNDFTWPVRNVASITANADLTLTNLESPLIANCPVINEGMVFCGSQKHLEGIKLAGIDLVNVANNHFGNYGIDGINETLDILKKNNINFIGNNNIFYQKIKNTTFAFLSYNQIGYKENGISWIDKEQIKKDLSEARKKAQIVIIVFHWGVEYMPQPEEENRQLAHFAIDHGADLVIGNHPHWIQPVEIYHDKLITYAHGNFVFDQEWSEETKQGIIGKYIFYENKLIDAQFTPIKIRNYGQAYLPEGKESQKILDKLKEESQKLQTNQK